MTTAFIDTDVIIRLLTNDDTQKQEEAARLFEQVRAGRLMVSAPVSVIADAVYVLSSARLYAVPRQAVSQMLGALVRLPGFRIAHRRAVLRALELFAGSGIDFGDALIVAEMERSHSRVVCSYDSHFDRIPGIKRVTPPQLAAER